MAAIFKPNIVKRSPTAISLMRGLAIKKLRVTPIGIPDERNPIKTGTALHEQNGVTTPAEAAIALPKPCRFPPKNALVRSMVIKERSIVTTKVIPVKSRRIFVES
jgi:hypothetical protein